MSTTSLALITENLPIIGSVIAAITGAIKGFKFVREGERGIKLQFGKAIRDKERKPIVIEPGFVILIPFIQRIETHHVRQQSFRFPEQRITLKDGLIYKVGGMVIFKVVDVYKTLFEIQSVDNSIDDLCMSAIKDVLEQLNHKEISNSKKVSEQLCNYVKDRAAQWGLEVIQFSLPESAPTPETAHLINARLGVKLRLEALKKGLTEYGLDVKTVNPNLAAVLIGIPMVATSANFDTLAGDMAYLADHKAQIATPPPNQ